MQKSASFLSDRKGVPMTCPYCGEEMEKGVLQGGGSSIIGWREKPSAFPNRLNIERLDEADWKYSYVPAFRCPKCRKVIFSY